MQETHSCQEDDKFWQNQWGNKIFFCHGTRRVGGKKSGSVIEFLSSPEGRWLMVVIQMDESYFILVNVYGFNRSDMNATLMSEISLLVLEKQHKFPSAYLIIGGDFKEAPNYSEDRYPPRQCQNPFNPVISGFCQSLDLVDAFRFLYPCSTSFTWFKPDQTQKSRIDLWLVSVSLISSLTSVSCSPSPLTDHCGIDLILKPKNSRTFNLGYWKLNCSCLLMILIAQI